MSDPAAGAAEAAVETSVLLVGAVDVAILATLVGAAYWWFFLRKKDDLSSSFDAAAIKSFSIEYVSLGLELHHSQPRFVVPSVTILSMFMDEHCTRIISHNASHMFTHRFLAQQTGDSIVQAPLTLSFWFSFIAVTN